MKYLLDTHVILWWLTGDKKISPSTMDEICCMDNKIHVSVASLWEIRIKQKINKLTIPASFLPFLEDEKIIIVDIKPHHTDALLSIDFHHRDPFDWMLIAQCKVEGFTFITRDHNILLYDIPILKA